MLRHLSYSVILLNLRNFKCMRISFKFAGCIGTFWKRCSLHNSDFSKHLHSYVTSYCCQTWTVDKDRRTNFARILQPVSTRKGTSTLKSLTSEKTPSATQFFKSSYKISNNPGLYALPSFAAWSKIGHNVTVWSGFKIEVTKKSF